MNKFWKKQIAVAIGVIGVIVLLRFLGVGRYITFEAIKSNRRLLLQLINHNYWLFVAGYISLYASLIALSLPVAVVLSTAGGFFFGTLTGTLYAVTAATTGSTILFLLVRMLFGRQLQARFAHRLQAFNKEFKKYGYSYLLTLHFITLVPLFIPNILAGLANVSLWTFVWTAAVGLIPGTLVCAFAGRQLMTINSIRDIFSVQIVMAILLIGVLSSTPFLVRYIRVLLNRRARS